MLIRKFTGVLCLALLFVTIPSATPAQVAVGISVHIGPPVLPVYSQPICPGPGYLWTPGYWAYGPDGYFWVPGTWVVAPALGLLWTPGYWGWGGGVYIWHAGYWGPHVGFYGGINYGYGYGGVGFYGGEWRHGVFAYNTAVTNVNTTVIHNTYVNNTVINHTTINNVSYNGGTGGTTAQPTAAERFAERERHTPATSLQTQHEQMARSDRGLLASENHGHPSVAATAKPGAFHGAGVVAARPANPNSPNSFAENHRGAAARNDRPPNVRTNNSGFGQPNNGNRSNGGNPNYPQHSETTQPNAPHSGSNNPNVNHHPNNNYPNNGHPNGGGHPQNQHANPENRPQTREHEPGHPGR